MSLADLPDELIAHVASYLNYEDTCSLMETTKKNYRAIKGYRKDKMKLGSIAFTIGDRLNIIMQTKEEAGKLCKFKNYIEHGFEFSVLENIVEECESVNCVSFRSDPFTRCRSRFAIPLLEFLNKTNNKIGHVNICFGKVGFSVNEFIDFCQKFKGSLFFDCDFMFRAWTDQVLSKIISHTTIIHGHLRGICYYSEELITDKTLKALIGENDIQTRISIARVMNSFTVKQIVRNLEILRERNIEKVNWDLGTLPVHQLPEAEKFFNPINGELRSVYSTKVANNTVDGWDIYMLSDKRDEDKQASLNVTFSVMLA